MITPSVQGIIAGAANIRAGENPPFTVDDFKIMYPMFWSEDVKQHLPDELIDMYVKFALAIVNIARYHESWKVCVCLVVAHFLILYLRSIALMQDPTAQDVINAAQTKGLTASKSVDGVSVSYDFSAALAHLDGWAAWTTTEYGLQFITYAKVYNMGGMRVW
jgi:hypothetical protein